TQDYLRVETSGRALAQGKPGGMRFYPNGLEQLNLKPDTREHAVTVNLRRGVTTEVRLVGPDDKPVRQAAAVGRSYIPAGSPLETVQRIEAMNGSFTATGCDPDGVTTFFALAPGRQLGAVVEVRGKEAGRPVTARLAPCGSVKLRFVDEQGKQ